MAKYSDKIQNIIDEFNAGQEKAELILTDPANSDYKREALLSRVGDVKLKNVEAVKTKAQDLLKETGNTAEVLTEKKYKIAYPNITSKEDKIAGEMQLQDAKRILSTNNLKTIQTELKQAYHMGRRDFVSVILDEYEGQQADIANLEYTEFLRELDKIRREYHGKIGMDGIKADIRDVENARSKAVRFLSEIAPAVSRVYIPDYDTTDFNEILTLSAQNKRAHLN